MSVQVNIRVPDDLIEQLDIIAEATGRKRPELVHNAIRSYVQSEREFIAAVAQGRAEIAAGYYTEWEDFERELDAIIEGDETY